MAIYWLIAKFNLIHRHKSQELATCEIYDFISSD